MAELNLRIERVARGSRIAELRHRGPLRIQRPFHPEGRERPHVYLLHPPGGLVSADRLGIHIRVEQDAAVLLTAPGATKAYRSSGLAAHQEVCLEVAAGGSMEWLPHEVIAYDGAQLQSCHEVHLAEGARYFGWEILCLGRPASGDHFHAGRLDLRQSLLLQGRPLLRERIFLDESTLGWRASPAMQRGYSHQATVMVWPGSEIMREVAQTLVAQSGLAAAGGLIDGLFVHRVLASGLPALRGHLLALWSALRPGLLGVPACPPRIWAT